MAGGVGYFCTYLIMNRPGVVGECPILPCTIMSHVASSLSGFLHELNVMGRNQPGTL